MASEGKILEQHSTVGGMLWLPVLWVVGNVIVAGYYITVFPLVGFALMALAVINAYLFWARSIFYRWYFIAHAAVGMVFMSLASGPEVASDGVVISSFIACYLLFSKRVRGTFTQPLSRNPKPMLFKDLKLKLVGLLFFLFVWVVADYYIRKDPVNISFKEYIRLNEQISNRIGDIYSITPKKKVIISKSSVGPGYRGYMYVVRGERGYLVVQLKRVDGSDQVELTILDGN